MKRRTRLAFARTSKGFTKLIPTCTHRRSDGIGAVVTDHVRMRLRATLLEALVPRMSDADDESPRTILQPRHEIRRKIIHEHAAIHDRFIARDGHRRIGQVLPRPIELLAPRSAVLLRTFREHMELEV